MRACWMTAGLAMALLGCAHAEADGGSGGSPGAGGGRFMAGRARAEATLHTAAGAVAGTASAQERDGALVVRLDAEGLPPGTHGVHVHGVGICAPPDFALAGPHWNPGGKQHGSMNPMGAHMGDLPNLTVGADGKGKLVFAIPGATVEDLLDEDAAAIVVHAKADDLKTDPSGNSGARIACGVFAIPAAA